MKEMRFFDKIRLIIVHPHKFFEEIKKEKGIKHVFNFYFVFAFFAVTINTIFNLPDIIKSKLDLPILYFLIIIFMMIVLVFALAFAVSLFSFVFYWIYHVIIKIFNGKNNFDKTYTLLYGATPLMIASLVPYYGAFKLIFYPLMAVALVDTAYIKYVGLQKMHKMSKENSAAAIIIGLIIGFLVIKFLKGQFI
jgi:hypothetical protein